MKRLTIMRHAKSSWAEAGLDDFDRPLNARGREAARRIGAEFRTRGLAFDRVLASTALRVRQTLDGVGETYRALPIEFSDSLYLATEQKLIEIVRATPDEVGSLLLVGHNPGLEHLVGDLARDDDGGLRNRVIAAFPTAAVAILELESWARAQSARANLVDLILPRELD